MSYISIDIDLDEIYDQLSNREKKELANWLTDDGFIENKQVPIKIDSLGHKMLVENCQKLSDSYYKLSQEQIELIETLTKNL